MDTTLRLKEIADTLDIAKTASSEPADGDFSMMPHAGGRVTHHDKDGHMVGMSIKPVGEKGALGYHYPNERTHTALGEFPDHERAHHTIVAHHRATVRKSKETHMTLDVRKSLPSMRLPSFSMFGGNDVLKEVTVAERAIQGEENASPESGAPKEGSVKTWCPSCKAVRRDAKHGECPDCKSKLVAKSATDRLGEIAKAFGAPADANPGGQTTSVRIPTDTEDSENRGGAARSYPDGPDVPEREHENTDRASDQQGPRACPHCGQAIEELDERTEQGQPHAHKCVGAGLDVLKAALA